MANDSKKKRVKSQFVLDKKFWVRLMAGLLVLLMLLSAAAMTIQLFSVSAYAADIQPYYTENNSDLLIAVGLMYADGVTVGFETRAENGFCAGALDSERHFTPLYTINTDSVSVTCDANLAKTGMTYYISSNASLTVGGWHIETSADLFSLCQSIAAEHDYDIFYAYINGKTVVRVGQFGSRAEAEAAGAAFTSAGIAFTAAAPSETGVSVVDPYTDTILYEFDCGSETSLGLEPVQTAENTVYLVTPAKNTYGGIFKYARYRTGNIDGVAVTNILHLEEYVEGVLPWEVGSGWPQESLRTFAVAIRSYALSSRKHETFDICNTTCCQVYKGRNRVNDAVIEAVTQTAGLVLSYNNKIVCTYYSSSTGGTTVSASDAWGYTEKYPYLRAVVTPWEQYASYPNASWTIEYTPAQLLAKLNASGYTSLSGSIKSVEILSYAENSSYVKSVKITDIKGNSVTIDRSDAIRSALGLNSANFVAAKAGENVTVTDYSLDGEGIATLIERQQSGETGSGQKGSIYVLSGDQTSAALIPAGDKVALTSELGMDINVALTGLSVISEKGIEALEIPSGGELPVLSATNIIKTHRTVMAEGKAGNFVFIGRGWGHGVGLSQYGAKSLAELGYDYKTILTTYLPGTVPVNYKTILNTVVK